MSTHALPSLLLISLIAGLPQLSETVYSPSLPEIARALATSESLVEYTLTIYLFGFAIGSLFWGCLSDSLGRKPCVLMGLVFFILGCIGCYFSTNIEMLMCSRLIQAFGGSIGSVLGQAISRDAFHGPQLGKAYATVGSSLALCPAIGPILGARIANSFGWSAIFLFLLSLACLLALLVALRLPETHPYANRAPVAIRDVAWQLLSDPHVVTCAGIVGIGNGIGFSYFAEGSFYLINGLGLSPSEYGTHFIGIALCAMCGGLYSRKLQDTLSIPQIMQRGLLITTTSTFLLSISAIAYTYDMFSSPYIMIGLVIASQMTTTFGMCMITSNTLAIALKDYRWCIGTASSIFGFYYYVLISLATLGMGSLHNGTLIPMPLYFLTLSIIMLILKRRGLQPTA